MCSPRPRPARALAGFLVVFTLLAGACGSDSPASTTPGGADITTALASVPGLTVRELASSAAGYRAFLLTLSLPVDHARPDGPRFTRRMTLLHRDARAPMIMSHTGYMLFGPPRLGELARLTSGNQLVMEHRFFGESSPAPADWSTLTIRQAASDDHATVAALRAIYAGRWLTSGASKGGMTALFHRYYFPGDVDGTVAYVAPINVAADLDPVHNRFIDFLARVGTAECRAKLRALQRTLLARRAELVPLMVRYAREQAEASFTSILGSERAFEFAVGELAFFFWQYGDPATCASLPGEGATASELFAAFAVHGRPLEFTDADLTDFAAYYHQSATEIGWVALDESALADLERYPMQDRPRSYLPARIPVGDYQPAVMDDFLRWMNESATKVLLVYGGDDPWSAGAIPLGASAAGREVARYFAPSQNHGAAIETLVAAERDASTAAVLRWAGLTPATTAAGLTAAGGALPRGDPGPRDPHPVRPSARTLASAVQAWLAGGHGAEASPR